MTSVTTLRIICILFLEYYLKFKSITYRLQNFHRL